MFLTLLIVTFVVALVVAAIAVRVFTPPIDRILRRIIGEDISAGWLQYIRFAMLVVGVSAGVRIHELERYISPAEYDKEQRILVLTRDRWVLELYRTIIETLEGIAWMLLWFFAVALIAYVIVRIFEVRRGKAGDEKPQA
ncbi:MAG TPA: hypothetical protein VJ011_12805 [Steroidobacteraceae bacterium]|nr:hypothetical protein [Steroidobacteraceae bacterium]